MFKPRSLTISAMILIATLSRLIPHPWNFTPIGAMALFGGARFSDRRLAFLVPLLSLFLGDLAMGFYKGIVVVYASFTLIVLIGRRIRKHPGVLSIALGTLSGSILFYLLTNFSVWVGGVLYPKTFSGLMTCYAAAIPFFRNTLLGDAFYTAVLFTAFHLAEMRFVVLREPVVAK